MSYLSVDRNFSSVTGEKQALFPEKFPGVTPLAFDFDPFRVFI
jgi:hypothetical protein